MGREYSMRMIQVLQDFLSCLGGRDMVAVVATPCGLQSPLTQRIREVYPPRAPPPRNVPVRDGVRQGLLGGGGGCSCDTPATPSKLRKEPRQGCSDTLERDRGECSIYAT